MFEITLLAIGITFLAYYTNKGILYLASSLMMLYMGIQNIQTSLLIFIACLCMFFAGLIKTFFNKH